jgi:hypothetical protein
MVRSYIQRVKLHRRYDRVISFALQYSDLRIQQIGQAIFTYFSSARHLQLMSSTSIIHHIPLSGRMKYYIPVISKVCAADPKGSATSSHRISAYISVIVTLKFIS